MSENAFQRKLSRIIKNRASDYLKEQVLKTIEKRFRYRFDPYFKDVTHLDLEEEQTILTLYLSLAISLTLTAVKALTSLNFI